MDNMTVRGRNKCNQDQTNCYVVVRKHITLEILSNTAFVKMSSRKVCISALLKKHKAKQELKVKESTSEKLLRGKVGAYHSAGAVVLPKLFSTWKSNGLEAQDISEVCDESLNL